MTEPACQYEVNGATTGLPEKAVKLARRVAGMQGKEAQRLRLEVLMLPDGTWYLIVDDGQQMEYLGQ